MPLLLNGVLISQASEFDSIGLHGIRVVVECKTSTSLSKWTGLLCNRALGQIGSLEAFEIKTSLGTISACREHMAPWCSPYTYTPQNGKHINKVSQKSSFHPWATSSHLSTLPFTLKPNIRPDINHNINLSIHKVIALIDGDIFQPT